jgi:hypothetical protein
MEIGFPGRTPSARAFHITASYDRSSFGNVPALYVNGVKLPANTITTPSGIQPSYSGTGYLGNKSGLNRAWNGSIDDLRIYNRLLSDAEVRALASLPPANLAPSVRAGTNQIVVRPALAYLNGTVVDDGKPQPPGALTVAWDQISGPGIVTFANSNFLGTTASFSTNGIYLLRLKADDGQVQTSDYLTITAINRPVISFRLLSGGVELSWPNDGIDWRLQIQTNSLLQGLSSHWTDVPGSVSNPTIIPVDPSVGSVFHRLVITNR